MDIINKDNHFWKSEERKQEVLNSIRESISKKKCSYGSPTILFPMEIYLLNNGYDFCQYDGLNVYEPTRTYINKDGNFIAFWLSYYKRILVNINCSYFSFYNVNDEEGIKNILKGKGKINAKIERIGEKEYVYLTE